MRNLCNPHDPLKSLQTKKSRHRMLLLTTTRQAPIKTIKTKSTSALTTWTTLHRMRRNKSLSKAAMTSLHATANSTVLSHNIVRNFINFLNQHCEKVIQILINQSNPISLPQVQNTKTWTRTRTRTIFRTHIMTGQFYTRARTVTLRRLMLSVK